MTRELGLPFTHAASRDALARRSAELDRQARRALGRARRLLGAAALTDLRSTSALLAEKIDSGAVPIAAGCRLVGELEQLRGARQALAAEDRTRRLAACEQVLARLRTVPTAQALVDRVCDELLRHCGFGRAVLGSVQDGCWRPWKIRQEELTIDWFDRWENRELVVGEHLLEYRLLRERRAALVLDTTAAEIHDIVRSGMSTSYVVAPIVPAGHVIGFLHCDHYPDPRLCDAADRDVLWRLAEGFGHLYMRTALVERLSVQREQVRGTLGRLEREMTELTQSEIALAAAEEAGAAPASRSSLSQPPPTSAALDELTPRQREVLRLLVAGASNQQIAEELLISVATVKTHVKRVLAALGARNRSQVIARFHGGDASTV
ncbi:MAG TPA: LuxR C-terminal-related transcriptional regulator [Solirubrobacteraceae bacterium]|jgi:DNA-binding CsgD family transcriptional regulator|nr:LuxR C-terminal-related transcriptional regulator [Solirubrobacteraceae bacterium]